MKKIVLASGSPRRKELLEQIGVEFTIVKSDILEKVDTTLPPSDIPKELSRQKAEDVCANLNDEDVIVIGADTVVSADGEILGKPKDKEDAYKMLKKILGKRHEVYTGVTFSRKSKGEILSTSYSVCTYVDVCDMSKEEIDEYLNTDEPYDKAGGYAIQGIFAKYIKGIEGDFYNVVGLPISLVYENIKK